MRVRGRSTLAVMMAALICALTPLAANAASAGPAAPGGKKKVNLGFDSGPCPAASFTSLAKAQGAAIRSGGTGVQMNSWQSIVSPQWALNCWANRPSGTTVEWAIPMLPTDGISTVAIGATGAYDVYFKLLAQTLVQGIAGVKNSAQPNAELRIGWEFNGSWIPWFQGNNTTANNQYIAYWRDIVNTMRSVKGQHFKFIWNLTDGYTGVDARKAYPGDKYVDIVGIDDYDVSWFPNTYPIPAKASAKQVAARQTLAQYDRVNLPVYGLNAWAKFAASHHKQVALSEWGLSQRADVGGHGGGDDPIYVHGMFAWARGLAAKNQLAFMDYFNQKGDNDARMSSKTKASTAAYKSEAKYSGR